MKRFLFLLVLGSVIVGSIILSLCQIYNQPTLKPEIERKFWKTDPDFFNITWQFDPQNAEPTKIIKNRFLFFEDLSPNATVTVVNMWSGEVYWEGVADENGTIKLWRVR
ncbi:MAG: hypothetical protein OEY10_06600 [Nitrosopumilus sp.]|nr:hypothetical protein [Nitrosopumilus sp.]